MLGGGDEPTLRRETRGERRRSTGDDRGALLAEGHHAPVGAGILGKLGVAILDLCSLRHLLAAAVAAVQGRAERHRGSRDGFDESQLGCRSSADGERRALGDARDRCNRDRRGALRPSARQDRRLGAGKRCDDGDDRPVEAAMRPAAVPESTGAPVSAGSDGRLRSGVAPGSGGRGVTRTSSSRMWPRQPPCRSPSSGRLPCPPCTSCLPGRREGTSSAASEQVLRRHRAVRAGRWCAGRSSGLPMMAPR